MSGYGHDGGWDDIGDGGEDDTPESRAAIARLFATPPCIASTENYVAAISHQVGHGIRFEAAEPHRAMTGGMMPASVDLPFGHYVSAKTGLLSRTNMDPVKLERALRNALTALTLHDGVTIIRTSHGLWIDDLTIQMAKEHDVQAEQFLYAGVKTDFGALLATEVKSASRSKS